MLVDFPKYILLSFVRDWIDLKELAMLDSATCSFVTRNNFLLTLANKGCPFRGLESEHTFDKGFISWISRRKICVNSVFLDNKCLLESETWPFDCSMVKCLHLDLHLRPDSAHSLLQFMKRGCWSSLKEIIFMIWDASGFDFDSLIRKVVTDIVTITHVKLNARDANPLVILRTLQLMGHRLLSLDLCGAFGHSPKLSTEEFEEGFKALSIACPKITSIDVSSNTSKISHECIVHIAEGCKELEIVNLRFLRMSSFKAIETLALKCRNIIKLDLAYNKNVMTDEAALTVSKNLTLLTDLNLTHSKLLTDTGMLHLCTGCTDIVKLSIAGVHCITMKSILQIANCLKCLRSIEYWDATNEDATNKMFCVFLQCFQSYSSVDLFSGVSMSGVPAVREHLITTDNVVALGSCKIQRTLYAADRFSKEPSYGVAHAELCSHLPKRTLDYFLASTAEQLEELVFLTADPTTNHKTPKQLSDWLLHSVCIGCCNLVTLEIYGGVKITGNAIVKILKANRRLATLKLVGCPLIDDVAVQNIMVIAMDLCYLTIEQCGVTRLGLKFLQTLKPLKSFEVEIEPC